MSIDPGTAIILAYVLVSMGVIITSLMAALAIHRPAARAPPQENPRRAGGG
jgi:hypothetical protein